MKTIAITIPLGMSARNILRSDAFRILPKHARLVILTPFAGDAKFHAEFDRPNVNFELLRFRSSVVGKILRRLADPVETYLFTQKTHIETLLFLKKWLQNERPFEYFKTRLLAASFEWRPMLSWLRCWHIKCLRDQAYGAIFKKYEVNLVLITHLFNLADQQVAATALHCGIPVIGMPHSWDNLTSKSGIRQGTNADPGRTVPVRFDKVIVWNDVSRQELLEFYGYTHDSIVTVGIPQFDIYMNKERFKKREQFMADYGFDPAAKLILYAAGTPQYLPYQDEIIDALVEIIRSGRLGQRAQLLVRGHPNRMALEASKKVRTRYQGSSDVRFQEPSSAYTALSDTAWNSVPGDEYELANTIAAADVVVTMGSTIILDAAALDKPIVNMMFDGGPVDSSFHSIKKYLHYTHYIKIEKTGAFQTAYNPQEMEAQIQRYLRDPSLESKERRDLVAMECFKIDGKAGERIAGAILDYLEPNKMLAN
ncbi:MAG: CDP-glycerol glycerophosphotransferase family protein [Elusimicrobia bacterium]|nr:CDP-glycerol glycerophosphotransferase family protein [Elusimicrobiota bacterium]